MTAYQEILATVDFGKHTEPSLFDATQLLSGAVY